jgi:hypothetical protein
MVIMTYVKVVMIFIIVVMASGTADNNGHRDL